MEKPRGCGMTWVFLSGLTGKGSHWEEQLHHSCSPWKMLGGKSLNPRKYRPKVDRQARPAAKKRGTAAGSVLKKAAGGSLGEHWPLRNQGCTGEACGGRGLEAWDAQGTSILLGSRTGTLK